MFDARIFIDSLENARQVLQQQHAVYKGVYEIRDSVYRSTDVSQPLEKVFLRLRAVPQNIWDEKPYIVSIKNTDIKSIGKQSIIPVKQQFDTEHEAQDYISKNYLDNFAYDFVCHRFGEQYFIGEDGVDLEIIEGHPSIEFKSKTEEGLQKLLQLFNVSADQVIKGPSVVAIKKILQV